MANNLRLTTQTHELPGSLLEALRALGASVLRYPIRDLLVNACFLFCFLSYVRFVPIAAENQPVASVFAFLVVLIYGVPKDQRSYSLLAFCVLVLGYTIASVAIRQSHITEVLMLGIGYLLPIAIFLAVWPRAQLLSVTMYELVLYCIFLIGAVQYLDLLSPLRPALDATFGTLFSRFESGRFEGGRGVGLIFSEPAAAAYFVVLFFLTNIFFLLHKKISAARFICLMTAVLAMAYFNRSGTLFVLALFLLASIGIAAVICKRSAIVLAFALVSAALGVFLWAASEYEGAESVRFLALLTVVRTVELLDLRDIVPFSILAGGIRLPSIIVGYGGLLQEPLGRGAASWLTDFPSIASFVGIDFDYLLEDTEGYWITGYIKPSAMAAAVALDFGLPGLLLLILFATLILRASISAADVTIRFWCITMCFTAFSMIFIYGITLLPVPWLLLAYSCALLKLERGLIQGRPR